MPTEGPESEQPSSEQPLQLRLYRIAVEEPPQQSLFRQRTRSELLHAVIDSRPRVEFRKAIWWALANVELVGPDGIAFRFGRDIRRKVTKRDDQTGDFVDEDEPAALAVQVLVDLKLQLCAILGGRDLAETSESLGRLLGRLMTRSDPARLAHVTINVNPLNDTREFLVQLRQAWSIHRLSIVVFRPNPIDVDENFTKPTEEVVKDISADSATTLFKGRLQVTPTLEALVTSAGSNGRPVEARIKRSPDSPIDTVTMKSSPVHVAATPSEMKKDRSTLLERMRSVFARSRASSESPQTQESAPALVPAESPDEPTNSDKR